MDSDSDVDDSIEHQESYSNGIKRQISNSSDTSNADGCQRKTRGPKLWQGSTQVCLLSCKHCYEEDTSDDDRLFD